MPDKSYAQPTDERPTVWALTRAREIRVVEPMSPGCSCGGLQHICSTHWRIAMALDQAYFEGKSGVAPMTRDSLPLVVQLTALPPGHPDNPTGTAKEFIGVQPVKVPGQTREDVSLDQVRDLLQKAINVITVQLVVNTVKRDLKADAEREPLVQIPGLVPPRGDLRRG